ncbi:MAG: hypothetical protein QOJ11_217 [Frankiales bacterium]|nr:hypothetical protein [Frankiales bacterium]
MRYMVMHYETEATENGAMPTPEQQQAIGTFMQEVASTGVLLGGEGVFPSSHGARVEFTGDDVRVIDGPFAEARELIAGFALLDVQTLAEAIEIARKFGQIVGTGRVDVRRVVEASDLQ